jgi:hypothetical protein
MAGQESIYWPLGPSGLLLFNGHILGRSVTSNDNVAASAKLNHNVAARAKSLIGTKPGLELEIAVCGDCLAGVHVSADGWNGSSQRR